MKAGYINEKKGPHRVAAFQALSEGLRRHGIRTAHYEDEIDFVVTWGDECPMHLRDKPNLVLEAGYINGRSGNYVQDRLRFVSTNWNGVHGRASSAYPDRPPDRWDDLGVRTQSWRVATRTKRVLLLGQVPGDRCAPGRDTWERLQRRVYQRFGDVRVREHPLVNRLQPKLLDDLMDIDVCVTWSSNAALETVIAGCPTIALDRGCIAYPLCSHSVDDPLRFPDRSQFLYNLAYRQWTHDELRSGEAWEQIDYGLRISDSTRDRADHARRGESAYPSHA